MAIEIGIFHNGASDLKAVTTPSGVVVNDGSLDEVHESYRRVLIGQLRQGIPIRGTFPVCCASAARAPARAPASEVSRKRRRSTTR